jgi:hypothetical protein
MITYQESIDVIKETAIRGSGNPDIDFSTTWVKVPAKLFHLLIWFGEATNLSLAGATWDDETKTVELHLKD